MGVKKRKSMLMARIVGSKGSLPGMWPQNPNSMSYSTTSLENSGNRKFMINVWSPNFMRCMNFLRQYKSKAEC